VLADAAPTSPADSSTTPPPTTTRGPRFSASEPAIGPITNVISWLKEKIKAAWPRPMAKSASKKRNRTGAE
jgi:hypothetical protein